MQIWASSYTIRARSPFSAVAKGLDRQGALIKVETSNGVGYADVHPWTELGDAPLAVQLATLSEGRPTSLGARSLALAELDARARTERQSAFAGLKPPPLSHRLVSWTELSPEFLANLSAQGFRTLKLKIGGELKREVRALSKHASDLVPFRLRLDANAQLAPATFLALAAMLPPALKTAIEFVEDPIAPSLVQDWLVLNEKSPLPLAIDRLSESADEKSAGVALDKLRAPWIVLKPAIQNPLVIADWARTRGAKIAVTSYLDHPVGQIGAALETARLMSTANESLLGTCGLGSHTSYEPNEFSEALNMNGPELSIPEGNGIGFDELFARTDWKPLK